MAKPSEKRIQAESGLPNELREVFKTLVEDYQASAEVHTKQAWVNYNILADMVRAGWRKA